MSENIWQRSKRYGKKGAKAIWSGSSRDLEDFKVEIIKDAGLITGNKLLFSVGTEYQKAIQSDAGKEYFEFQDEKIREIQTNLVNKIKGGNKDRSQLKQLKKKQKVDGPNFIHQKQRAKAHGGNIPLHFIIKMAGYRRRRRMKRSKRRFRKRGSAGGSLLKSLKQAGPIGNVKWNTTGTISTLAGQQDFMCLPLSATQSEVRNNALNYGPGGVSVSGATALAHSSQVVDVGSAGIGIPLGAIGQISLLRKDFIYHFNMFRTYRFKNPTNVNIEVVFHLVTCKKDIPLTMYAALTVDNTHEAITALCKTNAANWSLADNPSADYGKAALGAELATTSGLKAPDAAEVDEKGEDDFDYAASAVGSGMVGSSFTAWRRIGWTPKEVIPFRQHFTIKRSKKITLTSNSVADYKYSEKRFHKQDTAQLPDMGRDSIRQLHTRKGQKFLVVMVRGFPTIANYPLATYQNFTTYNKAAWSYDASGASIGPTTEQGSTINANVVTTSPAQLIYVSSASQNFGSKSQTKSTIRTLENVLPSAYGYPSGAVTYNEIAEDSEVISQYTSAHKT